MEKLLKTRKGFFYSVLFFMVMAIATFVGCSDDEEGDSEPKMAGEIPGLELSLSESGQFVYIIFEDAVGEGTDYEIFRSDDGGDFEEVTNILSKKTDTSFTDRRTEFGVVYQYFVNFENMYSDTVKIETQGVYKARVSTSVSSDGYGTSAVLEHVLVKWSVGAEDAEGVESFEVFRDGSSIFSYEVPSFNYGNDFEYKDTDVEYGQEYTYTVKTFTDEGETFESEEVSVTPERPDEIVLETPEIVDVTTETSDTSIHVHITDIGAGGSDKIEYDIELVGLNYSWKGETVISNLGTGTNSTMVLLLDATEAPRESGFQTLKSRVRIYTKGKWTDWSAYDESSIVY